MRVSSLGNPLVYQLSQVLKSDAAKTNRHLQQVNNKVENTRQAIPRNAWTEFPGRWKSRVAPLTLWFNV